MPYEVAGNAAGDYSSLENGRDEEHRHHHHHHSDGRPLTWRTVFGILLVGGVVLICVGIYKLVASTHDTRGDMISSWHIAMDKWQSSGLRNFQTLAWFMNTGGTFMSGITGTYTPANFGESSWDDSKSVTPSPLTTYKYLGTAQCPGSTPNRPCTITITAKNGAVLSRVLNNGPAQQVGPTPYSMTVTGCQWYDSDFFHPFATFGMGTCNRNGPQYGPECVDDRYLDANGCPNDVITTTYWTNPWFATLNSKPRFTYENGKCWDYSDCFCSGCGYTYKTDVSSGQGFTGYGYYYNGMWVPFTKPVSSMTGTERAQQCKNAMDAIGFHCPADKVNLICFNAGGFPKQRCSNYCAKKDASAVYTPAGTYITMSSYYGPWGGGSFPVITQTEGTCSYSLTSTSLLQSITLAVDSQGGNSVPGLWVSGTNYTMDKIVSGTTPLNLGATVPVAVEINSFEGPAMQGAKITNGCNMQPAPSNCFGPTQASNFFSGVIYIVVGIVLLMLSVPCLFFQGLMNPWIRRIGINI